MTLHSYICNHIALDIKNNDYPLDYLIFKLVFNRGFAPKTLLTPDSDRDVLTQKSKQKKSRLRPLHSIFRLTGQGRSLASSAKTL